MEEHIHDFKCVEHAFNVAITLAEQAGETEVAAELLSVGNDLYAIINKMLVCSN